MRSWIGARSSASNGVRDEGKWKVCVGAATTHTAAERNDVSHRPSERPSSRASCFSFLFSRRSYSTASCSTQHILQAATQDGKKNLMNTIYAFQSRSFFPLSPPLFFHFFSFRPPDVTVSGILETSIAKYLTVFTTLAITLTEALPATSSSSFVSNSRSRISHGATMSCGLSHFTQS
jgi:hypothetical protein